MSADLDRQIAALDDLPSAELRSRWSAVAGTPVPRISPGLLRLALAWELQARARGGLSRRTRQKLEQLATAKTRTTDALPGMRLVREWNGTMHVVEISADGMIRWRDRSWRSLSEVAREITGTRWSGPAFFGLTRKVAAA